MKHYIRYVWAVAVVGALLGSCADDFDSRVTVEKPENMARYEYLKTYDALKKYSPPGFKLGSGITVSEFLKKELVYSLACANFDELTAGNAMKYSSCVANNGSMDFSQVMKFVEAAKMANVGIYGHTLLWHAQQNNTYLNGLITPTVIPGESTPTWDTVVSEDFETPDASDYTHNETAVISFTADGEGKDGEGRALKINNASVRANDYDCQFFLKFAPPMAEGEKYTFTMDVKADATCSFGTQAHVVPYSYKHWDFFGNVNATTEWTTFTKEIIVSADVATTGTIAFNLGKNATTYYFDNMKLTKYNEKGGGNGPVSAGHAYTFTNPAKGDYWGAQISFDLPNGLTTGKKYDLKLMVRASVAGSIRAEMQDPTNYSSNGFGQIPVTTQWEEQKLTTTISAEGRKRFIISFGDYEGTVFIDDVFLCEEGTTANLISNSDFESGTAGWGGWGGSSTRGISNDGEGYGGKGSADQIIEKTGEEKKEILVEALETWIAGMMEACDGYVKAWDVVNEPMDDGNAYALKSDPNHANPENFYWQDYLGKEYVRYAVKFARQYGGDDLKLFANDYNLEAVYNNNNKCRGLIQMVEYWESDGVTKIDGIGTQMHISYNMDAEKQKKQEECVVTMYELLAASGKLIKVTELDMGILDESGKSIKTVDLSFGQHLLMADFYRFVVEKYFEIIPVAQQYGIAHWSPTDSPDASNSYWRKGEPIGLWDLNYNRKPAYGGFANGLAGRDVSKE